MRLTGLERMTMRTIRSITEDEMIATFLFAELHSPRFCKKVETYLQQYVVGQLCMLQWGRYGKT